jgi:uncharacterized repeat protein (TIGR03809 family)
MQSMSIDVQRLRFPTALALKWRALADRKIAHLAELYKSGRWDCYYSEEQLLFAIQEAKRAREKWDNFIQQEHARVSSQRTPEQIGRAA